MNKSIHLILILLIFSIADTYSQDSDVVVDISRIVSGYYQTIDVNPETPCNCDAKTERTLDLNKGLKPSDVSNYNLHAYRFTFSNTSIPPAKLFKALENDPSVFKVSMKEWESFMLLTTDKFDYESFEQAAAGVFATFSKMLPEDFLKIKNTTSYLEYVQKLEKDRKVKEEYLKQGTEQHK